MTRINRGTPVPCPLLRQVNKQGWSTLAQQHGPLKITSRRAIRPPLGPVTSLPQNGGFVPKSLPACMPRGNTMALNRITPCPRKKTGMRGIYCCTRSVHPGLTISLCESQLANSPYARFYNPVADPSPVLFTVTAYNNEAIRVENQSIYCLQWQRRQIHSEWQIVTAVNA